MTRTEQVNAIKLWYEHGTGKNLIETFLPKQASSIAEYYKTPQNINNPKIAGTYHFDFIQGGTKHAAYVGESGNIFWRLLEHLYNLFNSVTDWGIPADAILNNEIQLAWEGTTGISDEHCRREEEKSLIQKLKPFLQYTNPNSPEFGKDKKQRGVSREKISADICVSGSLRRSRARALFTMKED